jgi:hypothetical protein
MVSGPCVAMRTLWAIVAIANMELPDSINVGKGKSSFLHENEVRRWFRMPKRVFIMM